VTGAARGDPFIVSLLGSQPFCCHPAINQFFPAQMGLLMKGLADPGKGCREWMVWFTVSPLEEAMEKIVGKVRVG